MTQMIISVRPDLYDKALRDEGIRALDKQIQHLYAENTVMQDRIKYNNQRITQLLASKMALSLAREG